MAVFTQEQLYRRDKKGLQNAIQYLLEDIRVATNDITDRFLAEGIKENCEEIDEILTRLTRVE